MSNLLKKNITVFFVFGINLTLAWLSGFHKLFLLLLVVNSISIYMVISRYYDKTREYFCGVISHTVPMSESRLKFYLLDFFIWEGLVLLVAYIVIIRGGLSSFN